MWYVSLMQIAAADNFIAGLGVEAYRVGGSVRDEILGRKPKDADYMVRGIGLNELHALLRERGAARVTPIMDRRGQHFGWRAGDIEIALPRREVNDGGGRGQIIVADPKITLGEDALRRDFTFNALYLRVPNAVVTSPFSDSTALALDVVDPTGRGLFDLSRGLIQTTHEDSFRDDPLRTLRALRFVARGFTLSTETLRQMARWSNEVTGLSANGYASGTVLDEMSKILMGDHVADALRIARDTGVLASLFPELVPMIGFDQGSRYHDMTTDEHTFTALATAAHVDAPLRVRWALLFHDSGKPESAWRGEDGRLHYYSKRFEYVAPTKDDKTVVVTPNHEDVGERIWRTAAERINATRELREDVAVLIRNHMVPLAGKFKASKVRQGRVKFGDDMLRDLYLHRACDLSGKGRVDAKAMERLRLMEDERARAQKAGIPCAPRDLEVDGHDVMAAGIKGRQVGVVLSEILHQVASQPTDLLMTREWQLAQIPKLRHFCPVPK